MNVRVLSADFAAAASTLAQVPAPVGLEVAFAGRSNVGKSTLLGALSGRKGLARISKDPGRTRALVFFDARLRVQRPQTSNEAGESVTPAAEEARLTLVDLPGYGYAKISKAEAAAWKPLIEGYLQTRPTLRAVLVLIDIRRGAEREERELLEFLAGPARIERNEKVHARVVATKLDKLARHERKPALKALAAELGVPVSGVSGESGEGIDELWQRIAASCF